MIGRGGMGVVYKARDPLLNRLVAIKMIVGATPGLLKRFNVEARSTGSLQHPNIVTIYDFGDQDGSPYLVMEFLEGTSLDTVLTSHADSLSLANKLNICIEVCNGLNYAHERGIIHRDIKPANIMLLNDTGGSVKIVDFGIARIGDTGISHTEIVGTLQYMSPEQFQSQPLDHRTDIYSLGVVLYQLLTGVVPFQAAGEASIMYQIVHDEPPPLSAYLQEYPRELDGIVSKALAKNRDLRYPTGREFAFDLMAIAEKQKEFEVTQWLKRAETAAQRTEWNKAEDCLRQVLLIDSRHTQAHQLLNQVQVKIRAQRRAEQIRQLRTQADQAFVEQRYDDALLIVDQAISLDDTNQGLTGFRRSIQEAKTRAARLKLALRKAEEAHRTGDLQEAKEAVREALEIDPQETSAKALQVVILKQLREQESQQKLRQLLDAARDQISERNLTGAFETLKQAELLDPASVELFSLQKVVNTAREEQARKLEIENLTHGIEAALAQEDYAQAVAIAGKGLERYPQHQGLSKLKSLAEKEQRRVQLKAYAREQFLAANRLMESGKTLEALSVAEKALENVPGDLQLETLRSLANDRLRSEKVEDRKRQVIARAKELVSAEQFSEATRILEGARGELPRSDELESLLRRSRDGEEQGKKLDGIVAEAQELLNRGNPERAVEFLENKTLEFPDARLFDLLENARSRGQQFQAGIRNAILEATRILQQGGGRNSLEYLNQQPAEYRESLEFRAVSDATRQLATWEVLVQELARTSDPDAQIRLAEAAFRQSPESDQIKNKLAELRKRKEQINVIAETAKALEAKRQYADAIAELQRLRQIHSALPNLESEINRLGRMEDERLSSEARRESEQFQLELHSIIAEATRILQQRGAVDADRYLSSQPAQYRDVPEYRGLTAWVAAQLACETLDRELAGTGDPDAQVRLAEQALRQNPSNRKIEQRLSEIRARAEAASTITRKAQQLEKARQFGEASREWEKLRQICPSYPAVESQIRRLQELERNRIAVDARREQEEFERGLQNLLKEAERILQKQGGTEAAKYLAKQPTKYHESAELKAFSEIVAARAAVESLEQELARRPDPDLQLRAAEDALRQNPENTRIQETLASVRVRKEKIGAIAARARALEMSRQFAEAAQELARMRQLYAQYPRLDQEIQRLERLDREAKQRAASEAAALANEESSQTASATVIMGRPGGAEPAVVPEAIGLPPAQSDTKTKGSSARKLIVAVAAVVVVAAVFVAYRVIAPGGGVLIRLNPNPADSSLAVDGVPCAIPCQRVLPPGRHKIEAEHDGYTKLTDYFQVERGSSPDIPVTLSPVVPPPTNPTVATTGEPEGTTPKTREDGKTGKARSQSSTVDKGLQGAVQAAKKEVITEAKNTQPAGPAEPAKPPSPSPSGTFAANHSIIDRGDTAELSWNVQNATTVKLDNQTVSASGSIKVSPNDSTTYHLVAVGPGGEHDFDAAIAVNIPKAKVTDNSSVSPQEQSAISDLLQSYAATYTNKDAKGLQELWPGIPKEKLKVIKEGYKVNARVSFSDLKFIREPDGRVRVLCTQTDSNQMKPASPKAFTMIVNQKGGRWVIDYIPIQ